MDNLTERIYAYVNELEGLKETTEELYREMKYPKLLPMMRFETKRYRADPGSIFEMKTRAMGGAMELLTLSFTPDTGKDLPFLLIDTMSMKKKALAYVEYYDCTGKKLRFSELDRIKEKYSYLPDYAEKDAWYISERMPASLIKGGEGADENALFEMVRESIDEYFELSMKAGTDENNLKGLSLLRDRMINEGNPSSGTMEKVLGKDGYIRFYKTCVMPL